ncbi:MAG: hypothetical protein GY870_18810 [archaeon]|nr:hypothetical protein [archaeon]
MRIITTLFILFFSTSVYSEELPIYFDPGIDSYNFYSRASTESLLKGKAANHEFGFSTYEFKLGDNHIIQFIVHPGGIKFKVNEIKIIADLNRNLSISYPGKTITKKGIYLGMCREELISKLGKPKMDENDKLKYKAENNKGILAKYNMPIYYGEYTFKRNELISFSFGFEYP